MANEWFTPTDLFYIVQMDTKWTGEFKGRTLETELGFNLDNYAANSWERPFFDDFNTATPIGQTPSNITVEATAKTGTHHWWAPARGPTGSGTMTAPGYTRPDFSTPQYQQMSASTIGMGAVRLPTITGFSGRFSGTTMQTQRRSSTGVPPATPGTWSYSDNLAFSMAYGYVEAKMKLPTFPGAWPAFWAISDDEYYAPMFPRIEDDWVEMYNLEYATGTSHHVPWFHRPNSVAQMAPGWTMLDKGWSANSSPGLNNVNFDGGGQIIDLSTGFHTYGRYMKKDATAPGGLGWFIYYVDRIENCRIPLVTEWLRYYYLILSLQTQDPYQNDMVPFEQHWLEVDYVGAWRNPAVTDPTRLEPYIPPVLTSTQKLISIPRLERHLSQKFDIPIQGVIQTPEHSNTDIPPKMNQIARFVVVSGKTGSIGTVAVNNTPTNPVKYRLTGTDSTDFSINESTGAISAVGTLSTIKTYDLVVSAWDYPLTPCLQGTNTTRVIIDVREDATFGFKYWRGKNDPAPDNAISKLRAWIDASDSDSFDMNGSNQVSQIRDKSQRLLKWNQSSTAAMPVLNATGIGNMPAWETQSSATIMTGSQIISTSAIQNIVTRSNGALSMGGGIVTANGVYGFTDPVVFVQWWRADPNSATDLVTSIVNGTVVANATAPVNKSFTILAAAVFKADSAGGSSLGSIFDSSNLFQSPTTPTPRWFDGKLGEMGILYWPENEGPTQLEVDKLVGGLHHKWGLTSLLPANHPYKVTVPKLWE